MLSKLNFRFIIKFLGLIYILESVFMLSATAVSYYYGEDDFYPLLLSSGIIILMGALCYFFGRKASLPTTNRHEVMLSVTLTWLSLSLFGMLPYLFHGTLTDVCDAYFETMSGFTTTGATMIQQIEEVPHGILFWRSLTQWQGGVGMIVFTVALMPIFGGMAPKLFEAESTGITHNHFLPRITSIAKRIFGIYLLLTILFAATYWAVAMDLFDAVNHAMTTVSTGGYSTKNSSITFWQSPPLEYAIALFMCLSATNFILLFLAIKGKGGKLLRDEESRWFYLFLIVATLITTAWVLIESHEQNVLVALRNALFHCASLISTTGYVTTDFTIWGAPFLAIASLLMLICGCAGSTSGGLKMGRFVIIVKNMINEFRRQTHPHAVLPVRMGRQAIPAELINRVLTFFFLYVALIIISSFVITLSEKQTFEEAIGISLSCISNVGPGFGRFYAGYFEPLNDLSKWTLSLLMLVGRLELFTVLTLFSRSFWHHEWGESQRFLVRHTLFSFFTL